jgi:hypothetical protein
MKTKILIAVLAIGLFSTGTIFSQENKETKMEHKTSEKAMYTCPMHADVKSDKPGECPKCGMALKKMDMDHSKMNMKKKDSMKMKHDKMASTYTCPMHADVKSDKPGECPKCGMELKKMEMKKMDMKDKKSSDKTHKH